jgi:hypothetical protein
MRFSYQLSLSDPTMLDYVLWQAKPLQPWYYVYADGNAGRRRTRHKRGPRHVSCSMPHVEYRGPRPVTDHAHAYWLDFAVHASQTESNAGVCEALMRVDGNRITFTAAGIECITSHTLPPCSLTTSSPSGESL